MRGRIYALSLSIIFVLSSQSPAQYFIGGTTRDFQKIDAHVHATPKYMTGSVATLATFLAGAARNDREKARAMFTWVGANIQYDASFLDKGIQKRNLTAKEALRARRCVCGGFANLFQALCAKAGVQSVVIVGYSKDPGNPSASNYRKNLHAWNAVRIGGRWELLDVTWAAARSFTSGKTRFVDDAWFLKPPEQFVFSHFPLQSRWQLLNRPLSYNEFAALPNVSSNFFQLGFTVTQLRSAAKQGGKNSKIVKTWQIPPHVHFQIRQAPIQRNLHVGSTYRFVVTAKNVQGIVFKNGSRTQNAARSGDSFSANIRAPSGKFDVCATLPHPTNPRLIRYCTVLSYEGVYPFSAISNGR